MIQVINRFFANINAEQCSTLHFDELFPQILKYYKVKRVARPLDLFNKCGGWIQSRDAFCLCSWHHLSVQQGWKNGHVLKSQCTVLRYTFLLPQLNNILLPRTLWPAPCEPCHHSRALPWQRWRSCTGHACWSSNWNGSGIVILGLLDYPFFVFVVPKTFIVCNNILAMLFTVKL